MHRMLTLFFGADCSFNRIILLILEICTIALAKKSKWKLRERERERELLSEKEKPILRSYCYISFTVKTNLDNVV